MISSTNSDENKAGQSKGGTKMTKRERVIAAIQGKEVDHVPVGFSLHFPADAAKGEKGVQSHLEFFRQTDTDIIKIMKNISCLGRVFC